VTAGSISCGHLIAGEQVPAASGATFEDVDPATAAPFATLALGDA
jgi:acyl-CoA reductase-like NAD-dependent aldehyde dehydrogenase